MVDLDGLEILSIDSYCIYKPDNQLGEAKISSESLGGFSSVELCQVCEVSL